MARSSINPRAYYTSTTIICWKKYILKMIYHPALVWIILWQINQSCHKMGHKCFLIWGDWLSCDPLWGSHDSQWLAIMVIGYHVTLCEGHMIANHPIKGHTYSYHIRGDRSPLMLLLALFEIEKRASVLNWETRFPFFRITLCGCAHKIHQKRDTLSVCVILVIPSLYTQLPWLQWCHCHHYFQT